jgi:hypothetical protein
MPVAVRISEKLITRLVDNYHIHERFFIEFLQNALNAGIRRMFKVKLEGKTFHVFKLIEMKNEARYEMVGKVYPQYLKSHKILVFKGTTVNAHSDENYFKDKIREYVKIFR